jgi:hypothetical protein
MCHILTLASSTLIQAIQEEVKLNESSGLAYFFCDISDMNKRTKRGLLCSLVLSLFACSGDKTILEKLYAKYNHGLQKPTNSDLCEVLHDYMTGLQKVYLLIDALDECINLEEVLGLVKLIHKWDIINCHLLVTSRKEIPIVNSLKPAMPVEVDLSCNNMAVGNDVAQYIDHMMYSEPELMMWNNRAKELIKVTLIKKGQGM